MPGLIDAPGGLRFGTGLFWLGGGIGGDGLDTSGIFPLSSSNGLVATLDIDFTQNRAWLNGTYTTPAALLGSTRGTTSCYYTTSAGNLVLFNTTVLRLGTNGLLVEDGRTNSILQSQAFTNASWTKQASITAADNQALAPDATTTASLLTANSTTATNTVAFQNLTVAISTTYVFSIYAKQGTQDKYLALGIVMGAGGAAGVGRHVVFDLSAGAVAGNWADGAGLTLNSSQITALANGWFRCQASVTTDATNTTAAFEVHVPNNTTGYAQTSGDNQFVWGAQAELVGVPATALATSYVPTTTVAVTRGADAVSYSQSLTTFPAAAGTFYGSLLAVAAGGGNPAIIGQSTTNTFEIAGNSTPLTWQTAITNTSFEAVSGQNVNQTSRVAGSWSGTAHAISVNGAAVGTATAAAAVVTPTDLWVGSTPAGSNSINSYLRRFSFWNSQLPNSVLTTLSATGP